jgi:riboflavin kinase/FMN adenylyltransferase
LIRIHEFNAESSRVLSGGTSVTIGKFDGVHRGHQLLLAEARSSALAYTVRHPGHPARTCAFTFIEKDARIPEHSRIQTAEERAQSIQEAGADILVEYPFGREEMNMEPGDFVREILLDRLHMKALTVGTDFRFGHERRGTPALLARMAPDMGFTLKVIPKVRYQGEEISSTRIRECLEQGRMEDARQMMGHPYSVTSAVLHGKELGRTLDFPTLNLAAPAEKILPPFGVYFCRVKIGDRWYDSVANLGVQPTVAEHHLWLECNVLDFSGEVYGQTVTAQLLSFERPERKFSGVEELKSTVMNDRANAEKYFSDKNSAVC